MWKYIWCVFCLIWLGAATGARAAADTQPAQIPTRHSAAFFRRSLIGGYEAVGSHNPAWDEDARQVVRLAAERWMTSDPDPDIDCQIMVIGDHALAAGCDDPAVLYHLLRAHVTLQVGIPNELFSRLARTLPGSGYAPFIKVFAWARLMDYSAKDARRSLLEKIYAALPAMASEPNFPQYMTAQICSDLTGFGRELDGDRKPIIDKLYAILSKAQPDSATPSLFLGLAYWRYSWDAAGVGEALPPESPREQRHKVAEQALGEALKRDPNLAYASATMVGVRVDEGLVDDETENYFQQAIRQDPDCDLAYRYEIGKLNTGEPGARADLIAFGHMCLATQRWESRIPFMLLRAHRTIAGRGGLVAFYKNTPEAWQDVKDLYEGYIAAHPMAITQRVNYALIAAGTGHLDIKTKQLDDLKPLMDDPILKKIIANQIRGLNDVLKRTGHDSK